MIDHVCHPPNFCYCNVQATEPDDQCPIHGFPKRVDNCMVCGRFVKRENYEDVIGNQGRVDDDDPDDISA